MEHRASVDHPSTGHEEAAKEDVMAEEDVTGRIQGPNGERLEVRVGSKSVGLTTKDLPLIILMALMGVGFYLAFQSLTQNQERAFSNQREGFHKIAEVLALLHTNQASMLAEIQTNRDTMSTLVVQQNTLLGQQTKELSANQVGIVEAMHSQTSQMRSWLAALLFKLDHPEQPVSLDLPLPPDRAR
jgi:hypothetical protein